MCTCICILKNCGVKPSSASVEASCAQAPKDPYPHRPAIHEKVGKVGAYARRQAALRATVIHIYTASKDSPNKNYSRP